MNEPLPAFSLARPATVDEALAALAADPSSLVIAGGTDLVANMRRGLVEPQTLVDLSLIPDLDKVESGKGELVIGARATLSQIAADGQIRTDFTAIAEAAGSIAGPGHRAAATAGGNLCLDTRCIYYNQSHWWRKSNGYCLKYKGDTCHVAPTGNRCRAAFCGDLAPALLIFGARLEIAGPEGRRNVALADFYREDGADHLDLKPGEIVLSVHLPANAEGGPVYSSYAKVRLRGAIDFPLAGVAVSCRRTGGTYAFNVALTGTNSAPVLLDGRDPLTAGDNSESFFNALNKAVQKQVSPQRTTTFAAHYRRLSVSALAARLAADMYRKACT